MNDDQRLIDLHHLGRERVIGAWLVGDVLIDPGPESCLPALLEGLGDEAPRVIALTHIHLDHAGATGSLIERFPEAEVWVHESGASHMIDPGKLLASAERLYGEDLPRLWGEFVPVPAEQLRVLHGGEELGPFRVEYTPGHARHHVSYMHEPSRRAFTGDVAGVRIGEGGLVLPPTPPPDVDLEAWRGSLEKIEAWGPASLAPTHFGHYEDVAEHLQRLRERLDQAEELAAALDEAQFVASLRAEIREALDEEDAAAYEQAMPPEQSFQGLLRYLRKRAQAA